MRTFWTPHLRTAAAYLLTAGAALLPAPTLHAAPPELAIDFSGVGYRGGVTPPVAPAILWLLPSGGDDTVAIQAALDRVGARRPDANGFRGAVLLGAGTYRVSGPIRLGASGLVLRGQDATLLATGIDRRAVLVLEGTGVPTEAAPLAVASDVPVGATTLPLVSIDGLTVGDRVFVRRPSTKDWLRTLGMDSVPGRFHEVRLDWTEGSRDLSWDRRIVALDAKAHAITLDAPITMPLEARFGGGYGGPVPMAGAAPARGRREPHDRQLVRRATITRTRSTPGSASASTGWRTPSSGT